MLTNVENTKTVPSSLWPQLSALGLLFAFGIALFSTSRELATALMISAVSLGAIAAWGTRGVIIGLIGVSCGVSFALKGGSKGSELLYYLPVVLSFFIALKTRKAGFATFSHGECEREQLFEENEERKREVAELFRVLDAEKRSKEQLLAQLRGSLSKIEGKRENELLLSSAKDNALKAEEEKKWFFQERNLLLRRELDRMQRKVLGLEEDLSALEGAKEAKRKIDELNDEINTLRTSLFDRESVLTEYEKQLAILRESLRAAPEKVKREEPLDLHFFHMYKQLRVQFEEKEKQLHEARSELFRVGDLGEVQEREREELALDDLEWEERQTRYVLALEGALDRMSKEVADLEEIVSFCLK